MATTPHSGKSILHTRFRPIVGPLKKSEKCSLKRHFVGVLREVIGYLEHLERSFNRDDRFLFVGVETIVKHCTRLRMEYKLEVVRGKAEKVGRIRKDKISKRDIEYALKFLREKRIISGTFTNEQGERGFVVAPHDALFARDGQRCCYKGINLKIPVKWERIGDAVVWKPVGKR